MESATVVFSWAASAIGILGFISVVIQQILFYKRDSKTMDRIEGSISSGHDKLERNQCGMESRMESRMESGHSGLENRMERDHRRLESRMEREHSGLESEHGRILTAITDVDKRLIQEFTEQKAKRTYLDGKESIISESISNLMSFSGIMEDLKKENVDLKEQNRTLAAHNQILQEKILSIEKESGQNQSQSQKQERSRQTHRDIGEELEL